ncbi:MAG: hypothetical protein M1830_001873 [Pleopsidium flavum]|nr:MAG: hypothetical protein M1830_001873 [Pleopsidium flavum]
MFADATRFGRAHRHGGFENDLFGGHLQRGAGERRRRARSGSWSSGSSDSEGFHSDYGRYALRRARGMRMGGHRRLRSPGLDGFGREGVLGRLHGVHDDGMHNTRTFAVRIPARAMQPHIIPGEVFLFPQHILHLKIHIERDNGQSEAFRAAVPSNLTIDEVLTAVGLQSHNAYRVLLGSSSSTAPEEISRDSRVGSVARRMGRDPRHLYVQRRRQ